MPVKTLLLKDRDGVPVRKIPIIKMAQIKSSELRMYIEPLRDGVRFVATQGICADLDCLGVIEIRTEGKDQ